MGRLNHLIMKNYFAITHPGHRSDAICADGLGNFGRDVPAGLFYYCGFYLTATELAQWKASDAATPHIPEDSLGLGLMNS